MESPQFLGYTVVCVAFPEVFPKAVTVWFFFDAIKCSATNVHPLDGTPIKSENGRTLVALRGASDKFTHQFQRCTYWTDSATVIPIRLCAPAYFDFEARETRRNPWQFWFLLGQFPTAQARRWANEIIEWFAGKKGTWKITVPGLYHPSQCAYGHSGPLYLSPCNIHFHPSYQVCLH